MNDAEIIPMAQYFKNCGITLRFIEFMDVGNDNSWSFQKVVTKQNILQKLQQSFQLEPIEPTRFGEVAKYYRYAESDAQVGFITSVSESFALLARADDYRQTVHFIIVYLLLKD